MVKIQARRVFRIPFKLKIIRLHEKGFSIRKLARKYQLTRRSIRNWIKLKMVCLFFFTLKMFILII